MAAFYAISHDVSTIPLHANYVYQLSYKGEGRSISRRGRYLMFIKQGSRVLKVSSQPLRLAESGIYQFELLRTITHNSTVFPLLNMIIYELQYNIYSYFVIISY